MEIAKTKQKVGAKETGEVVKFDEAGMPQLDVWLEDETVWLSQAQMAELFGCAIANVNMHLNHIYADAELEESATIKEFLIVRFEGKRRVSRSVKYRMGRHPFLTSFLAVYSLFSATYPLVASLCGTGKGTSQAGTNSTWPSRSPSSSLTAIDGAGQDCLGRDCPNLV